MKTIELSIRQSYEAPRAEVIALAEPLSMLVSLSAEAGIDDWIDDGDEL